VRQGIAVLGAVAAVVLAGCGASAGDASDPVGLAVTRGFGARDLVALPTAQVQDGDSALDLLQRSARVTLRDGGRSVGAIGGLEAGRRQGRPYDWRLYVNGVQPDEEPAEVRVRPGDRIWWDHHDVGATPAVPAVVGSFPEPFVHGLEGKRLPVRVECVDPAEPACDEVARRLAGVGAVVGRGGVSAGDNFETLRVLVGRWAQLRQRDLTADRLDLGPARSGVYASFDRAGTTLTVLDPRGRPARRLRAGTGLVAVTRRKQEAPLWLVTGTDLAGVRSAARALDESALADKFALAISQDRAVRVPAVAP
jgi:hypothetical protein